MEARKEAAPMLEREEKKPEAGELSESDLEQVPAFDIEKERDRMVRDKRKRLATEYETLREPLLELRVTNDEKSKAEYERIRTQFLMQIIEEYARGDLARTRKINEVAKENMGEEIGDRFPKGVQIIIDEVSAVDKFNDSFDKLLETYPEGRDAIPHLNELIPKYFEEIGGEEENKESEKEVKSGQEQMQDALHPVFDEIKEIK